jgi:hypothetical protein
MDSSTWTTVEHIFRDLLIFVAVMTALLIALVVIVSYMPDDNPLKRVFSALSYRVGATAALGALALPSPWNRSRGSGKFTISGHRSYYFGIGIRSSAIFALSRPFFRPSRGPGWTSDRDWNVRRDLVLMSFRLEQQIYLSETGDANEVALAKHFASRDEAEKFASRLGRKNHPKWQAVL